MVRAGIGLRLSHVRSVERIRLTHTIGWEPLGKTHVTSSAQFRGTSMNGLIYLVGLVVVIMALLSFLGLH